MTWTVIPDAPYAFCTAALPVAVLEGVENYHRTTLRGVPVTIVPHDYQTWHRLRRRGVMLPPPTCRYDWSGPFTPMDHQKATVDFLIEHAKAFCLNGLRTGKTLCALWGADYLMSVRAVRRVLVVAPKRICDIVWERTIFQHLPHRKYVFLKGDRAKKQRLAEDTRIDILIVNPESLHLLVGHLPEVDLVIIDEFTRFKNVRVGGKKSRRYHALTTIVARTRLWLLSGTPNPQSPLDAYGPVRLVNPRRIGFTEWRDMTMLKVSEFRWVPRRDAAQTIATWMTPAIRFKREDCIDIPSERVEEIEVALTKQQRQVIEDFRDRAAAEIREGVKVTAVNAAAVLSKIQQVMAGGVYGVDAQGDRATYRVDATPFLDAVESVVQESDRPVLVFANFHVSVDVIADHLEAQGFRTGRLRRSKAVLDGQVVGSSALFDEFQNNALDAIVAVPSSMQYGLELSTGYIVLWTTAPGSYETYDQAIARVTGSRQTREVIIMHVIPSPIAKELFKRLETRAELQDTVLDLVEGSISI